MSSDYRNRDSHARSKLQTKSLTLDEFPQAPERAREETLSWLVTEQRGLKIACQNCGKARVLSPLEAVASYGGLLRFSEVRQIIWGRCKADPCGAAIGPTLDRYSAKDRS